MEIFLLLISKGNDAKIAQLRICPVILQPKSLV